MDKQDINNLPKLVSEGHISKQRAGAYIWENVYMHPHEYGLSGFSEDELSDFLIELSDKFQNLFDSFIPGIVQFRTFITGFIFNHRTNFIRTQVKNRIANDSMQSFLRINYDEEVQKYNLMVSEFLNQEKDESPHQNDKNFSDVFGRKPSTEKDRNKRIAEVIVIILAMKACKDLDDELITKISKFTGIDATYIHSAILSLKDTIKNRTERKEQLISKRNNAFFYHRKYLIEMLRVDKNSKLFTQVKKQYEKRTKSWERQNIQLAQRKRDTPTSAEIADALGLKTRTVLFYINHARKGELSTDIKHFLEETDEKEPEE